MLWFLLALITALIGLLVWMLFAKLQLQIDTKSNFYQLQWQGIFRANIIPLADDLILRLRIFFWQKDLYPLHWTPKPKKKSQKSHKPNRPGRNSFKWIRKGKNILRSFRVRLFRLRVDTGDYVRNSYWYPVFYFLSNEKRQLSVNFNGINHLQLHVENQLYRILLAIIR